MKLTRAQLQFKQHELEKVRRAIVSNGDTVRRQEAILAQAKAELSRIEGWALCLEDQIKDHEKAVEAEREAREAAAKKKAKGKK